MKRFLRRLLKTVAGMAVLVLVLGAMFGRTVTMDGFGPNLGTRNVTYLETWIHQLGFRPGP